MQVGSMTGAALPVSGSDYATTYGIADGSQNIEQGKEAGQMPKDSSFSKLFFKGLYAENAGEGKGNQVTDNAQSKAIAQMAETESDEEGSAEETDDMSILSGLTMSIFMPMQTSPNAASTSQDNQAENQGISMVEMQLQDKLLNQEMLAESVNVMDAQLPEEAPIDSQTSKLPVDKNKEQNSSTHQNITNSESVSQNNIVDRITDVLRSMSGEADNEQSFSELLSNKQDKLSSEPIENDALAGTQQFIPTIAQGDETVEKAASVERALSSFVDDLKSAESTPREIRILLEPENLGELHISVTRTENGITAKIRTDDKEICSLIGNQLQKLVQSIENKGITVDNVDVFYGQADRNMSSFSQNLGNRGDQQQPNRSFRGEDGIEAIDNNGLYYAWRGIIDNGENTEKAVEYLI